MQKVKPEEILAYFDHIVDYQKAKQLESLSAARAICYLSTKIRGHNIHFHCHYFLCCLCGILLNVLFERRHNKILTVVNIRPFFGLKTKKRQQILMNAKSSSASTFR